MRMSLCRISAHVSMSMHPLPPAATADRLWAREQQRKVVSVMRLLTEAFLLGPKVLELIQ